MEDNNIRKILAYSIPYFAICGGIWEFFYWSTFDIRILQSVNSIDIIKAFVFPFVAASGFFLLGHLFSVFFLTKVLPKEFINQSEPVSTKKLILRRTFIILFFGALFIIAILSNNNEKWVVISILGGMIFSIWFTYTDVFISLIPDRCNRYNFIVTIVMIPFLCFGMAKSTSLDILEKSKPDITITLRQSEGFSGIPDQYILVGFIGDFVYMHRLKSKSIIMIPKSEIIKIEYLKNSP